MRKPLVLLTLTLALTIAACASSKSDAPSGDADNICTDLKPVVRDCVAKVDCAGIEDADGCESGKLNAMAAIDGMLNDCTGDVATKAEQLATCVNGLDPAQYCVACLELEEAH